MSSLDHGRSNQTSDDAPHSNNTTPNQGSTSVPISSETHSSVNELQSVNAKITMPEFWHQNIKVWFQQVEAQFALFRIQADITKYNLLLTQLKPNVLTQVASLVENPPENNKYDALKKQIINVFSDSEQRRIKTLLSGLQLGARKPSHLLNEQSQIAGSLISDQMLKSLWISQLPQHIQAVIVAAPGNVQELASIADKIWDMVPESHYSETVCHQQLLTPVGHYSKQQQPNANSNTSGRSATSLEAQIAELSMQVKQLRSAQDRTRSLKRGQYKPRTRSTSQNRRTGICWYHHRFGHEARKCNKPCNFKPHAIPSENC